MKIIDLSMPICEGMQTFATYWHPFVEVTQLARHGIENRESRKIIMGTHTGSHIDAPRHFIPGGQTAESVPLEQLCGEASVLDFSAIPDKTEISKQVLIETVAGRSVKRVLCRFDWDKKALGTARFYSDHAFFSEDACQWLVDEGCGLIALDTPQPDNPKHGKDGEKDAPNHKILLGNQVIIAECLVDLALLTRETVELIIAPIKLVEGDGAPARCFVIER